MTNTPSMWLIRTKLEAPAPTDRLISRPRLRRHLPAVLRNRLTFVHAPAGFGKTSLLAEWQRCFRLRNVHTAWLSLDEDDSEPLQFLAYLTASLGLAGVDVGELGAAAERGFPDVPIKSLITAITRTIERSRARIVVLIDDYHRLQGPAVEDVLMRLVDALHARVSFVIASREQPVSLPNRLAAGVARIDLSGDELRFDPDEARELLRRSARTIAEEDLDAFATTTDGWAIALAAVRDWLAAGWSVDRIKSSLAHPTEDLGHYIVDQVLRSLSEIEREFLRRTAIVNRFNEDLAAILAEELAIREVIDTLVRKDLLVVIWDGDQQWFRHHHLIAEVAVAEVGRDQLADLHRRAAEWFFNAGHYAEAVRHAVATRDDALLAQLFERAGGWKLLVSGHIGLTRSALTLIQPAVLCAYPRSHMASIVMLAKQGRLEEARREFAALSAAHSDHAEPLVRTEIALLDIGLRIYEDAPTAAEQAADLLRVSATLPQSETALRATIETLWCNIHFECGDLESAIATSHETLINFRTVHSLAAEVLVYVTQGAVLLEMGRLRDAQATLRQAWYLARDTTGPNTESEAIAAAVLALAEYESGNLEEAERLVSLALPAFEQGESWFHVFSGAYTAACALARHREGTPAALSVVERVRQTAVRRKLPRLESLADVLELRERVLNGEADSSAIGRLESALSAIAAAERSPRIRMRAVLELARLSLVRGQWNAASMKAGGLAAEAKILRHQRIRIEALIVQALALHALGQADEAAGPFESAVSLAMHEDLRQVFCDFGAGLLTLLQTDDLLIPNRRRIRIRERFLSAVIDNIQANQRTQAAGPDLSEREGAVARLLAEGLSNKAIAKALQVSESTVKFHLKNIFAKLDVPSRADAIAALATSQKN